MSGLNNKLVESLRKAIVDLEEYNELNLNEEELNTPLLEEAVRDGANAYDRVPPLSTTDLGTLTTASGLNGQTWSLIKQWAIIEALRLLAMKHIRNQNPVNDQGFSVDESGKAPQWMQLRSILRADLKEDTKEYKRAINIAGMPWGTQTMVP